MIKDSDYQKIEIEKVVKAFSHQLENKKINFDNLRIYLYRMWYKAFKEGCYVSK